MTTNWGAVELPAVRVFAPLPRAGFGQRRGGRSCRDGWDGRGSRPWWFGDGQAGCGCAAARSGARSSMYVLLSYCVLTCTRVRVGVVQCGLVIPASYEARGICCPYIYDVYKSLTLSSSRAESAVAAVAKSVQCTESRYMCCVSNRPGTRETSQHSLRGALCAGEALQRRTWGPAPLRSDPTFLVTLVGVLLPGKSCKEVDKSKG